MSHFPEVNPQAESTWQNHRRPCSFPGFDRALKELFGVHVSGRQNLRLAWAPDVFHFQLGRPRFRYVDSRIPTRRKLRRLYYQVKLLRDPFAPWITVEPKNLGRYPEGMYLHMVHHDVEIVTISRQQWVIERYIPPERIVAGGDSPELWNERRYRFFTPPETDVQIYGDADGPFPSDGQYRLVYVLEAKGREYGYRGPCERDLEVLRAASRLRDNYRRTVSRAQEIANDFAADEERDRKRLEELDQQLKEELKPYERKAEGNAFIAVPSTFEGAKNADRN